MSDDNKLIVERKKKLEELSKLSKLYPNSFKKNNSTEELRKLYGEKSKEELELEKCTFSLCGRLLTIRKMGNSSFANLHDESGKLQLFLSKNGTGKDMYKLLDHTDLGDIVGVEGIIFRTKTGELTLNVSEYVILSKSLRPLPEKYHGLSDVEIKYRQRYVDLMISEESRKVFSDRIKIVSEIRKYFEKEKYLEVETPMMHPIAGGAAAKPFITHHNSLDMNLFLRIAPELYLKRLIIGGFEKVFEINRSFRNEGLSVKHNPEFTMIEFYAAYENYNYLMELIEKLIKSLIKALNLNNKFDYQDYKIDTQKPFEKLNFHDSIIMYCDGIDEKNINNYSSLEKYCESNKIEVTIKGSLHKTQLDIFEKIVENKLVNPTFVTEYPTAVSPLSRRLDSNPEIVERFELFIAGREIANGFSELNDPNDQAQRFNEQLENDDERMNYDADFITAMEYGMPPTAGAGIGIDRLVMLLTNSASIRDVIFFPLMKPKN
jgi:lysyl-tRNA synthetase class 2